MKSRDFEPQLIELLIKLMHIEPAIYRSVLVRNTITFERLHEIIQVCMGWQNYHLYSFKKGDIYMEDRFAEIEPYSRKKFFAHKYQIANFLEKPGDTIEYVYDFGDNWLHNISVSKVSPDNKRIKHPKCLIAERACPPEDCGGVGGYYYLMNVLFSQEYNEDRLSMLEWLGGEYKPEYTSLNKINNELKNIWID
jgi:hypothetical protein